jgi:hypothetical protein
LPPDRDNIVALNPQPLPPAEAVALNPQPLPPEGVDIVAMNPQPLPPADAVALNPQPLPPDRVDIVALNPQPLPPADTVVMSSLPYRSTTWAQLRWIDNRYSPPVRPTFLRNRVNVIPNELAVRMVWGHCLISGALLQGLC